MRMASAMRRWIGAGTAVSSGAMIRAYPRPRAVCPQAPLCLLSSMWVDRSVSLCTYSVCTNCRVTEGHVAVQQAAPAAAVARTPGPYDTRLVANVPGEVGTRLRLLAAPLGRPVG